MFMFTGNYRTSNDNRVKAAETNIQVMQMQLNLQQVRPI